MQQSYRALLETIDIVRRQEAYLTGEVGSRISLDKAQEMLRRDWVISFVWLMYWVKDTE